MDELNDRLYELEQRIRQREFTIDQPQRELRITKSAQGEMMRL